MRTLIKLAVISIFIGIGLSSVLIALQYSPRDILERFQRGNPQSEVKTTLTRYFVAWQKHQPQTMYAQLSALDKAQVSLERFNKEFNELPSAPLSWQIKQIKVKKKVAIATLSISWPQVSGKGDGEEIFVQEQPYVLVKENKTWKISEQATFE
jgi:hypothetical protein